MRLDGEVPFPLPDVPMPPQCAGCGVQCEAASKLMSLMMTKHMADSIGETLVGEEGEAFDAMVDEHMPEEASAEVKQGIRMLIGEDIETLDTMIEETKHEIDANALACSGVLKMRASKGDVTYTVSICTSPRVYTRDKVLPEHLPTHIRATSNHNNN